jgi:hypothetical protein
MFSVVSTGTDDDNSTVSRKGGIMAPQGGQKLRRYFYGSAEEVYDKISESVLALKADNNVTNIFEEIGVPTAISNEAELKVVYKDDKNGQKLEYSIRWPVTKAQKKEL